MSPVHRRPGLRIDSDALVCGGGAAGVAAAVTAARQGLRVTLVERYGFCGGGAVAGMSGTVCGLYAATDDRSAAPEQLVFGFAVIRALRRGSSTAATCAIVSTATALG